MFAKSKSSIETVLQCTVIFPGPNTIAKSNVDAEIGGIDGRRRVTYTPIESGVYRITIKFNDKEIIGWNCIMEFPNPRLFKFQLL